MYYDDNDFIIPTYQENNVEKIIPIAAFIGKKIKANKIAFITSTDGEEKTELLSTMVLAQSSLLLLCMAYFAENNDLVEIAKEIIREK